MLNVSCKYYNHSIIIHISTCRFTVVSLSNLFLCFDFAAKSRTPKAKQAKSPVEKKSASKSKDTASPKPRKSPAKEKSEKKVTPKAKSASKTESKKSEAKKSTPAVAVETAPIVLTHMSSEEDEARTEMESDADWCGELYPSIAMSDSVNAIGHLYAGFVAANNGHIIASLGFISVWLAAIVGVMRFGISEKLFAQANSDLANLASNIGYPLIGLSYAAQNFTEINLDTSMIVWVGVVLVFWEALTRSFLDKNRDNAKLLVNIVFFVAPVAASCRASQDYTTLGALIAFVLAGIVITPHHDNRILGVRCVDWFHYIIGVTAIFFANGLGKIQF